MNYRQSSTIIYRKAEKQEMCDEGLPMTGFYREPKVKIDRWLFCNKEIGC